jgi:hypothetical protein
VRDAHQLASPVTFFHLTVDQTHCYLPSKGFAPTTPHLSPMSEMGGESIEVEIEAITGEQRQAVSSQALSQGVDDPMGRVLRAGTQMEHGQKFGAGVDGQPEPKHLCGAAQPGAQFIQL